MFARISRIEGKPDRIEKGIRDYRDNMVPQAKQMQGFREAYLLVDRKTGRVMGITLWDSEKDLQASTVAANKLRSQGAQASGSSKPPVVEIYEVAVAETARSSMA